MLEEVARGHAASARERDAAASLSLDAALGRTPLVRHRAFEPKDGVEIYAKLESRNPGGSVKDRAALAMIRDGEARGLVETRRASLTKHPTGAAGKECPTSAISLPAESSASTRLRNACGIDSMSFRYCGDMSRSKSRDAPVRNPY